MAIHPEGAGLLMRLMSSATQRRDVLANNIASQNLPGFRRREVVFEEKLQRALEEGTKVADLDEIEPEISTDWESPMRADGNSVNAEEENSLMRENRIRFELYAMILKGQHTLVAQAINSDR
ncbi:MAG: flagellar basal body rod protein FlgB [Planctomycetota bacterium]